MLRFQVSLKTHRTKAGLIKAVTKIEPLSTGTMTGLAIQFALNVAFSEAEGARVRSPDISKVGCFSTAFTRDKSTLFLTSLSFFFFGLHRLPSLSQTGVPRTT